jgi:hypothetical protein
MQADLFQNRCGAPDEHAAVPKVVSCFDILRRPGGIRLFYKFLHSVAMQPAFFA